MKTETTPDSVSYIQCDDCGKRALRDPRDQGGLGLCQHCCACYDRRQRGDRARFHRHGVVHFGRVIGAPDGADAVIPLCEERVYRSRRSMQSTSEAVNCMNCLVEEVRRP